MKKQKLQQLIREEISKILNENFNSQDVKTYFRQFSDEEKDFAMSVLTLLRDRGDITEIFPRGFNLYELEQTFRNITKGRFGIADIIKQHKTWLPTKLANSIFSLIKKYNEMNP